MPALQQARKTDRFYGWINAVILFFIYGTMYGFIFYGFTVVFPAMVQAMGWSRGEAALSHTVRGFSLGLLAPLASYAVIRYGSKRTMIAGLGLGILVMLLLGTATSKIWHWTILWGIIMPVSFSLGGAIPIQTTVTYWFNVKRGTVLGIVLSGAAVAGFISAPLYTFIIEKSGTWQSGWLTAAVFISAALVSVFFLKNKPADVGQFPDDISPEKAVESAATGKSKTAKTFRADHPVPLKEAIKLPVLYLIMACMVAQISALYLLTVHGVLHLTDQGFSKMEAASVIGNLILFSGFARIPIGILGDRIEPRWIITVAMAGMGLALLGFWKTPASLPLLLVLSSIFGFSFGATVPMFPTIIGNYFSPASFASVNGFIQPFMILLGAPVPLAAGMIYDKFNSYDVAFGYVIILVLASVVSGFFLVPPRKSSLR